MFSIISSTQEARQKKKEKKEEQNKTGDREGNRHNWLNFTAVRGACFALCPISAITFYLSPCFAIFRSPISSCFGVLFYALLHVILHRIPSNGNFYVYLKWHLCFPMVTFYIKLKLHKQTLLAISEPLASTMFFRSLFSILGGGLNPRDGNGKVNF